MERRELLFGIASLIGLALEHNALASPNAKRLLRQAQDLSRELSGGAWQTAIEKLLAGADVEAIAEAIDLDRLLEKAPKVERGARVFAVPSQPWLSSAGAQVKLFAFEPGRANPPHAHDRMVSVHLVLRGRFRVRHFERVRDESDTIVIRPTIDRTLGPREATSISDARNNVHWHVALERGVLLDVVAATQETRTHLIDPDRARREGDLWFAPRIDRVEDALRLYG
jgi:quercetin dioxygenase-like cupin family protein